MTTNVSGLMIPAKPASIANDPPMINMMPAKRSSQQPHRSVPYLTCQAPSPLGMT